MLTKEAIAFSELGRTFRDLVLNFEESVTDKETINLIASVYEKRLRGRITKFVNVTLDDEGNFKGEFQQYVNPRLTKRFSFVFGGNEVQFKPLNADDIEKFSEGVEDFAKGKRDAKTFKCKIAPCGGRCLKSGETCRQAMTSEEKKTHDKALRNKGRVDTSLAKKRRETKVQKALDDSREKLPLTGAKKDISLKDLEKESSNSVRSNHKVLAARGEEFTTKFDLKTTPASRKETKLLEEVVGLQGQMRGLAESGASEQEFKKVAVKFVDKEKAYLAEADKRLSKDEKEFTRLRDKIKSESSITPKSAKEIIGRIDTSSIDASRKKSIEADLEELCVLTGGKGFTNVKKIISESDRGYTIAEIGLIDVGINPKKHDELHEIAHHIEIESTAFQRSAVAFRESKATSLTPAPLRELMNDNSYNEDEKALPGRYIHPYVGKIYKEGHTEVISVGVEHFASPRLMRELYQKDKEHFHYALGVLLNAD